MMLISAVVLLLLMLAVLGVGVAHAWRRAGGAGVLVGTVFVLLLGGAVAAAVALYTPHPRFDAGGASGKGPFPDER